MFTATTSTVDICCHVTLSAFSSLKGTNPIPSSSPPSLCFPVSYVLTAFPGFFQLSLHLQEKLAHTTGCGSSSLLQTYYCLVIFSAHIKSLHQSFSGTALWAVPDGILFKYLELFLQTVKITSNSDAGLLGLAASPNCIIHRLYLLACCSVVNKRYLVELGIRQTAE